MVSYNDCKYGMSQYVPPKPFTLELLNMGRARNEANVDDVDRLLREVYPAGGSLQLERAADSSVEEWLDVHVEFVVRLLALTPRPTSSLLKSALTQGFEHVPIGRASAFAGICLSAVTQARQAQKSMTNGEKLHPSLLRVVRALSESPEKRPRVLQPHVSVASSDDAMVTPSMPQSRSNGQTYTGIVDFYARGIELTAPPSLPSASSSIVAPVSASTSDAQPTSSSVPYVDPSKMVMIKNIPDGSCEEAKLEVGPNGFATASFGGVIVESEMPNLLLRAASLVAARPATNGFQQTTAAKESGAGDCVSSASKWETAPKYTLMFYARDNKAALRR